MKGRMSWLLGRTLGLSLLAVFANAGRPAGVTAQCSACQTDCVPNPPDIGGVTCQSRCNPATSGGSGCSPKGDGKGCSFGGTCGS